MKTVPAHAKHLPKKNKWVKAISLILLTLSVFAISLLTIFYIDINSQVVAATISTEHLKNPVKVETPKQEDEPNIPVDGWAGRPLNLLIMGIDARVDQDTTLIGEVDDDDTIRSDSTLILNISADRENVNVVSIPRDILMKLPECYKSNRTTVKSSWGQFNWAFSLAAGTDDLPAGIACTEKTVEKMTGIDLDGFIVVDFTGFYKMIETLGGVDICLEEGVSDEEYINLTLEKGCQKLDPLTATKYARIRYTGDGSDMGRIARQQELIAAMFKQVLNSETFTDLPKMYAFISATIESLKISDSLSSIKTDAGLAWALKDINQENIRFSTMPVVTAEFDHNKLLPKEPTNEIFWETLRNENQLPVGTVYSNLNGEIFTITEEGNIPGGERRTDNEFGTSDEYYYYSNYGE